MEFVNNTTDDIVAYQTGNDYTSGLTGCGTLPATTTIPANSTVAGPSCIAAMVVFTYKGLTYSFPETLNMSTNMRLTTAEGTTGANASPPLYGAISFDNSSKMTRLTLTTSSNAKPKFSISANVPLLIVVIIVIFIGLCMNLYIFIHLVRWLRHKL